MKTAGNYARCRGNGWICAAKSFDFVKTSPRRKRTVRPSWSILMDLDQSVQFDEDTTELTTIRWVSVTVHNFSKFGACAFGFTSIQLFFDRLPSMSVKIGADTNLNDFTSISSISVDFDEFWASSVMTRLTWQQFDKYRLVLMIFCPFVRDRERFDVNSIGLGGFD